MAASEEQLLSLEDVANRLKVSDQSVRRWIKAGKLAAYKPGLEWRIRPSDLEEFLRARSYPKVQAPLPDYFVQERRLLNPITQQELEGFARYVDRLAARDPSELTRDQIGDAFAALVGFGPFILKASIAEEARPMLREVASRYVAIMRQLMDRAEAEVLRDLKLEEAHNVVNAVERFGRTGTEG